MTNLPKDADNNAIPALKPGTNHVINYDASTTNTVDFSGSTRIVRLLSTSKCRVKFGAEGITAASTDMPLVADVAEYFSIGGGKSAHATKIAVIKDSVAGTLEVTEMQ